MMVLDVSASDCHVREDTDHMGGREAVLERILHIPHWVPSTWDTIRIVHSCEHTCNGRTRTHTYTRARVHNDQFALAFSFL